MTKEYINLLEKAEDNYREMYQHLENAMKGHRDERSEVMYEQVRKADKHRATLEGIAKRLNTTFADLMSAVEARMNR